MIEELRMEDGEIERKGVRKSGGSRMEGEREKKKGLDELLRDRKIKGFDEGRKKGREVDRKRGSTNGGWGDKGKEYR